MNIGKMNIKNCVYLVIGIMLMTWAAGCTNKTNVGNETSVDSTEVDSLPEDTLETLIEEMPMPKAADELFDDFLFNFAANKKLQYERVDFPLKVDKYGKVSEMDRKQWRMEHFFMRQGFFTLVVSDMKEAEGSKDVNTDNVVIEKIYLGKNCIQQYLFNRVDGLWKLQQLNMESMKSNKNGDFYDFYNKFVNDSTFRQNAMAETVDFYGPDPDDDFNHIEGSIMPEQWDTFAPELPKDVIYNIIYGDRKPKGSQRILVIRGIANGLETILKFKKTADGYQLVKIST